MEFEDFKKAKANAKDALKYLESYGMTTHVHALKKYITLLEAWNDKMVEALEKVKEPEENLEPVKIN